MPIPQLPVPRFPINPAASQQEMQKLSDAVAQLQRTVADNFAPWPLNAPRPSLPVVVKITGTSVTSSSTTTSLGKNWYTGKMQLPPSVSSGTKFDPTVDVDLTKLYVAKNTADDCYVLTTSKMPLPPDGTAYVLGEMQGLSKTSSVPVRPVIIAMQSLGVFPVTLSSPSGSAGANSPPSAATYTYTVKDSSGTTTLGTGISLWFSRQSGHVTAATHGIAAYIAGTLYIINCDEVIDATTC